jgi:hypothetical protein
MTNNYKIHLRVETEVLHPYESGVEIGVKWVLWLMTTKNAVEIGGGVVCYIMMATKTDQEIIVSRKYESGVEIVGMGNYYCMTTKNAVEIGGGNTATDCMSQKAQHGDV